MVKVTKSSVKVKICGITNAADALHATAAGCDALGFVFYDKSPRFIKPELARSIIKALPAHVITIGVFFNAREASIRRIAKLCGLQMLQFHGDESPEFCRRFAGFKIIKGFRVKGPISEDSVRRYDTFAYLFDTYSATTAGGTGRRFDWRLIRHFGRMTKPIFLSGGLNERNIHKAIATAVPDWVDVCTSIEKAPGKKDPAKMSRFVSAAKKTA